MSSTEINFICGLLDKAADKLRSAELTKEEYDQLHIYLIKLNKALYGGSK
jgi:hypothetical protein